MLEGSMSGMFGAGLYVAALVPVFMVLFVFGYAMLSLQRRVKDHVTLRRRVTLTARYYPRLLRDNTDWWQFVKATSTVTAIGFVIGAIVYIFAIGVVEVFL